MRKESIKIVENVMNDLGITTVHLQGDNSNFFAEGDGIEKNAVIFDDENEMCWAIRINKNFPNSRYRTTAFDYGQIQYMTLEQDQEELYKFIDYICGKTGADAEKLKEKFAKSPYDKRDLKKIKR